MIASKRGLTAYDEQALRQLLAWKQPRSTLRGRAADRLDRSVELIADFIPAARTEAILTWAMPLLAQATQVATSERLVMRKYQRAGHVISRIEDIAKLPLSASDAAAGDKRGHEAIAAAVPGAGAGFLGGPTVFADISLVLAQSVRSVQSRALVYGFDPGHEVELTFALQVLDEASQLGPKGKRAVRAATTRLARDIATRRTVKAAFDALLARLPTQIVSRLVVMNSESVLPIVGALGGAGFNAWYMQSVTAAGRMAYRERFLRRRYGSELMRAYGL